MNETIKSDLKINGSGKSPGGFYNNVTINGSGEISGNVECTNFKVNGSGSVLGDVKSELTVTSGSSNIKGNVESGEYKVNGSSKINGNAICKSTKVNGSFDITGFLKGDDIQIRGSVKIGGDCTVETFDSKGGFGITGLLNAGEINIEIYGPCSAKEIGGEKITVKVGRSFGMKKLLKAILNLFKLNEELNAELIEADEIYLENVKAKIVRGNNVTIGEGCEIELVEYKNELINNGDSKVTENKRIV
jgi:cytoskeletal protein CcmA (bactofilin family)